MTATDEPWPQLHDATLDSIELRWSSGEALIRLKTGDANHPHRVLVATGLRHLDCPRELPWGPSASINQVRGPAPAGPDTRVLEIEMQSGDTIRIEAAAFSFKPAPAPPGPASAPRR